MGQLVFGGEDYDIDTFAKDGFKKEHAVWLDLARNKNYWNSSNLSAKDPVVSNLCSQIDIQKAAEKANRRIIRKKKELEKKNKINENQNS